MGTKGPVAPGRIVVGQWARLAAANLRCMRDLHLTPMVTAKRRRGKGLSLQSMARVTLTSHGLRRKLPRGRRLWLATRSGVAGVADLSAAAQKQPVTVE